MSKREDPDFMISKLLRLTAYGFFSLVFFAIGVGLCAIFLAPKQSESYVKIVQAVVRPAETAFGKKNSRLILLLGLDYSYDSKAQRHTKNARTDTIMLVRVEPRGQELSLMSLPRDLLLPLASSGGAYDKVNAAYAYGGVQATIETIEAFTKLKIDNHIIIKSDVVKDIVDELGGVAVQVDKAMDYDDNWAGLHIHLKPGRQTLNGEQAVGFCRFRHDEDGDFGRMKRQQQFLTALIRELKKPSHIPRYKGLAEAVSQKLKTDLSTEQMVALASLYRNFPLNAMQKGRPEVADYFEGGVSYLIPVEGEPQATITKLFPPLPDASLATIPVVVEDYRPGERRRLIFLDRFPKAGFGKPTVKVPARQGKTIAETSLIVTGNNSAVFKILPQLFPGVQVRRESPSQAASVTLRLRATSDIL